MSLGWERYREWMLRKNNVKRSWQIRKKAIGLNFTKYNQNDNN